MVDPERALEPGRAARLRAVRLERLLAPAAEPNPALERLFAGAAGVVKLRLVNQRVAPVPMEPRAVLAHWDEGPQKLTVWTSTQTPHGVKQQIAICLGLPEIRIRVDRARGGRRLRLQDPRLSRGVPAARGSRGACGAR